VGTKQRRIVHTQGAEVAAKTKVLTAKHISEALGFRPIEGVTEWTILLISTTFMNIKGTSRSTLFQVLYISQLCISNYNSN